MTPAAAPQKAASLMDDLCDSLDDRGPLRRPVPITAVPVEAVNSARQVA